MASHLRIYEAERLNVNIFILFISEHGIESLKQEPRVREQENPTLTILVNPGPAKTLEIFWFVLELNRIIISISSSSPSSCNSWPQISSILSCLSHIYHSKS